MGDPLRGTARYTADLATEGALHAAFLRSDHAHAELRSLDTADAAEVPGVVAVLTAADLGSPGAFPAFLRQPTVDGRPLVVPRRPVLCEGRVRHVGELVAMVVADSQAAAMDGVDALMPDFRELPVVVGLDAAATAPAIHPEAQTNTAATVAVGDAGATRSALDAAARIIEVTLDLPRLSPVPLEPLSAIAAYDIDAGVFDLWTPHQGIAEQRRDICAVLGVSPEAVRVHAEKVGGAFGARGAAFPETLALLAAARKLGRTVRWQGSRSDGFLADYHGRGMRLTGRLALDADHRFTAIEADIIADLGAYVHPVGAHVSVNNPLATVTGCYAIPAALARFSLRFTNAVPVGPLRGAGRPEMALLVERLVDEAAAATGLDPLELRHRNALRPDVFPYITPVGSRYDSGDYAGLIDKARMASDWDGFPARAEADRVDGLLRGIGAALFVEVAGGGPSGADSVRLDVDWHDGAARIGIVTATQSTGQDHADLFHAVLSAQIGLPSGCVELRQSAPQDTPDGDGSFASRTTMQAGAALHHATVALVARLVAEEAARHGLDPEGLRADAQAIRDVSGTILSTLPAALDRAASAAPFSVTGRAPGVQTFPSGCHVAEVQVDAQTGRVTVTGYVGVDDAGTVLSPHGAAGQVRGGIVQGVSGALMERHAFDSSGQLMSASLMDYPLARAGDMPMMTVIMHDVPSDTNPLGVKGVGEAGTTGALAATSNAVADALRRAGVALPPLPLTPSTIWRALQDRPGNRLGQDRPGR